MTSTTAIYPVSDLRTNLSEINEVAMSRPVILTKNGRSSHVIMSSDLYEAMEQRIEEAELDRLDAIFGNTNEWLSREDAFAEIRSRIHDTAKKMGY